MPSEFRFLIMCLSPFKDANGKVTLDGVVSNLVFETNDFPLDVKMYAVVGAVLRDVMWGKSLDLMAWQMGNKGERETLVKYRGTPLIMPKEAGAVCLPYPITVPIWTPGIYGFDLMDRDGTFGPPKERLATYLYAIGDQ